MPLEPFNPEQTTVERKPFLPLYVEKLIGWAIITTLALYTSAEVSKAKIDILANTFSIHQAQQANREADTITRPEFVQFKTDLTQRLDRLENKIDKLQESQGTQKH